ncbi:glycosyltransferase family 4 protein [Actinomyces sp.]|uniref:glycosyltransferase family 4 protein n=1 Tax=Actinomyces sp. TaxID=29317 RepID=UPI0026DB8A25|nr:glycosyltransferase family 4 protein [Actinomyces sp.]MDO4899362.1 glycosyltransferase family 4 protein [Actinomyces sp.]
MRVTAVTTWFPTTVSPSRGSFVARDLAAIATLHDVRLVHLVPPADDDGTRRLRHAGIDVLRIPMAPANPVSVADAASRLGPALGTAQVVHSMAFSSLLPLVLCRSAVPWVHTEHWSALTNPATLPRTARAALPVARCLLAGPDVVTAVCDYLAAPIRGVRGSRETSIVPCIVEPYPVVPRRDREDGTLRLVSVGGLIDRKDPLLALEVVAELVRRGVDAHLTWVGEGPLHDAVAQRATMPDLAGRIALAGAMDAAGVRVALADADMFLGTTKADNFFVSAAEAIVAGRPVVVGATGGQAEYLTPTTGALVDSRDPGDWADALLALDRSTRDVDAVHIAATIGDAFSTPVVAAGYNAAYRNAIALRVPA